MDIDHSIQMDHDSAVPVINYARHVTLRRSTTWLAHQTTWFGWHDSIQTVYMWIPFNVDKNSTSFGQSELSWPTKVYDDRRYLNEKSFWIKYFSN